MLRAMGGLADILGAQPALIGMVHVGALPGAPGSSEPVRTLAERASDEARVLAEAGFDAVIVENMHDAPYVHGDRLGPEVVAAMTRVVAAVAEAVEMPIGVQVLSGGNRHAIAVAHATDAAFIRCENFVYAHVADEGLLAEAEAGPLLRYRRSIGADRVRILADVKKKHASHAITGDLSIGEAVRGSAFFGADGLVITGSFTGEPASLDDLQQARAQAGVPVLVGSGVTPENAGDLLASADGLIVGSWIKRGGHWAQPVDPERCAQMARAFRAGGQPG